MSIVQISRIQIRRGKAQTSTGLPQLASGEMAWALDTQELWIGTGSVAEGAPYVDNVKILTELDLSQNGNILDLIQYIYRNGDPIQTGPRPNLPVYRSLQHRFDDYVSTQSFGTVGDGVTDDTSALQRAINQLYLNPAISKASDTTSGAIQNRVTLEMPAGTYRITRTLYIPSYVSLVGAGNTKTNINYDPIKIITGTTALGVAQITTSAAADTMVGSLIVGPGIPVGATVTSVVAGISLNISVSATSSHTNQSIRLISSGPAIRFINDSSTIGNPAAISTTTYNNQPKFITLKNLSISVQVTGVDRGIWSNSTAYAVGDIVAYNNYRYQAYVAHTGQTPPAPFGGSLYWTTVNQTGLQLDCVRDSQFENINIFHDNYDANGGVADEANKSIVLNAFSDLVTCERNVFTNISISGFTYAIYSINDITDNKFINCKITDVRQGFVLGFTSNGSSLGQQYGPTSTVIKDCKFVDIKRHAIIIGNPNTPPPTRVTGHPAFCSGNTITNCQLLNVGNNGGTNISAQWPQIYIDQPGNIVEAIQSDRIADLSSAQSTPYVPEVAGDGKYSSFGIREIPLGQITTPQLAFRLPVNTDYLGNPTVGEYISYTIEYSYRTNGNNNRYSRKGTLRLVADVASTLANSTPVFQLTDEYDFAGTDTAETIALSLDFTMSLLKANGTTYVNGSASPASIAINYTNPIDGGTLVYSYTSTF